MFNNDHTQFSPRNLHMTIFCIHSKELKTSLTTMQVANIQRTLHCKKLLQVLPVNVGVILQHYRESAVTFCEPTVTFLNLQLIVYKILHEFL